MCIFQSVFAQLNLLDSHDVSRFLSLCGGDERRYRLAVLFQMTFPGIPSVFYGDEKGISGISEDEYRAPMTWEKEEDELFAFYKKAIRLRREHTALRHGDFRTVYAARGSGLYLYARETDSDTIIIAMNVSDTAARLPDLDSAGRILRRETGGLPAEQIPAADKFTGQVLWQDGLSERELAPMGWALFLQRKGNAD